MKSLWQNQVDQKWSGSRGRRWLLHVLFWLSVLVFYTLFFGYKNISYRITFSFVIILLPATIITTYFLNYWLIPKYLFRKKYGRFILYFVYTIIVSFYIEMVTVIGIFVLVAELNLASLHPSNTNALILIAGMYLVVFLGAAIKLASHYQSNQIEIQKLKSEKVEAELKFLKAQLHPHFLFNTLNNLYALTLEKSDKAADVVLKISSLLDYVLYQCNAEFVPFEKELEQMENYISLEKLRYGDRLSVIMEHKGDFSGLSTPPMLFMTLLENSFKHGVSGVVTKAWIRISMEMQNKVFSFRIENSVNNRKRQQDKAGGIGLENLQNRLQLIYKDDFRMDIDENFDNYCVSLDINKPTRS